MTRVPFTYTWIEPGRILAGSIPQLPEDLDILRSMGVTGIITLTRRNIWTYPNMSWWGDRHYAAQFSIPDGGIADDNTMLAAAHCLTCDVYPSSATEPAKPMVHYIHCRGGIGRTGTILLAYYVLYRGMTLAQAKELVKIRRNYEGNASAIDQGSPQKEWIDLLESKR